MSVPSRFRFAGFVLSPRRRALYRDGRAVPLIPKYFELLLLLVVKRHEAVSKQAIFSDVWSDVIVSDGALAQAVRTLRRTLGDEVKDPKFIRTVSRHGYQFVWTEVVEEPDDGLALDDPHVDHDAPDRAIETLVDRLVTASARGDDEARDLAEQLHALGTADAIARLSERPNHGPAVAMMRDARWDVADAGSVPLLGDREAPRAIAALVRLRVAAVKRTIARRWTSAAAAGIAGGALTGAVGGLTLWLAPGSSARPEAAIALAAIGATAGGLGAAGVAAGLVTAEVLARSRRRLALLVCGAVAGGLVALAVRIVGRAVLDALFGVTMSPAFGSVDGLLLGGAAGIGYGAATSLPPGGGIAAPRGLKRLGVALTVGLCCGAAGVILASLDYPLVGGLVHEIARSSQHSTLELAPLGRLIGEPDFGPLARRLLSALEGTAFGFSLALGLTRRPGPSTADPA
jgi:DNA-binding winged helix-turn-helix (wHTH) protein